MFKRINDDFFVDAFKCNNGMAKIIFNKKDASDPHGGINSVELKTLNDKYIPSYIGDYIVKSKNGKLIGYDAMLFESIYEPVGE